MIELQTERAKYRVKEGVFHLDYVSDDYYDVAEAIESIKTVNDFLDRNNIQTLPIIVSSDTCNPKFTFGARKVLTSKEAVARYTCIALVVNNQLQKILGNLYIAMNTNPAPIRLFESKQEALVWVEEVNASVLKKQVA